MFTGIIQKFGYIEDIDIENNIYKIKTILDLTNIKIGSSICCDGVCLTVIDFSCKKNEDNFFFVNIGEETIRRSNLINWKINSKINLEKSLRVGDEIAGHFVYGHVDVVAKVLNINNLVNSWEFNFSFYDSFSKVDFDRFIVEKGSISINGISLTIASIFEKSFLVSILPYTYINTNLSFLKLDDIVNIEFDPLSRYIQKK